METKSIRGVDVSAGEQFANQIRLFRRRYDRLLAVLGEQGTLVEVDRVRESDPDIPPYSYIRNARHIYAFPRLEGVEATDRPDTQVGVIEGTQPYTLFRESKIVSDLDLSSLPNTVAISYDDAGSSPLLEASIDLNDTGEWRGPVETAIATAFESIEAD